MTVCCVGITRFSVVTRKTLHTFSATRGKSLEDAKRLIHDPARLRKRIDHFKSITLRSYESLTRDNVNSHAIILANDDLPAEIIGELKDLAAASQRIKILEVSGDDLLDQRSHEISKSLADGNQLFSYRLDDDDALSFDFVENITRACELTTNGVAISAVNGFRIFSENASDLYLEKCVVPFTSQGLGVLSDSSNYISVFALQGHNTVHWRFPTLCLPGEPSWIYVRHAGNDSKGARTKDAVRYSVPDAVKHIATRFPFMDETSFRTLIQAS